MPSTNTPKAKALLLSAALAGGAFLGAAGIAHAATSDTTAATSNSSTSSSSAATAPAAGSAPAQDPATMSHGPNETLLTGTTADQVTAAALKAVPGGTIIRVETDSAGSPYEAHVKKSDGTTVTLKFDSNFNVTATEDGFGAHPAGQAPPASQGGN